MNKLSLPPTRNKPVAPTSEAQIEAIINKGGSPAPAGGVSSQPAPAGEVDPETIRHVNTRLTEGLIRRIDTLRAKRPRRMGSPKLGISLRDWIVEAVVEKLEREDGQR